MDDLTTTVLIPTLWRHEQIGPCLDALFASTSIPVKPLFLCAEDDDKTLDMLDKIGHNFTAFPRGADGEVPSMVAKCNAAAEAVTTPFLFGLSDDVRLRPGCMERCHEALADGTKHVACVSDGISAHTHEGDLTGHCLIRVSYIREQSGVMDEPNMLMHPGYKHFFSDLELMKVGKARGVYVSCYDAKVDHPNPNNGTAPLDRVHHLTRSHWMQDHDLYRSREHMWEEVAA